MVFDPVRLRMERVAAAVSQDLKRGVNSLAAIASVAPLFGFLGTCIGIVNSFKGCAGEKSACQFATFESLSEGVMPAALGLFVAVPAWLGYRFLSDRASSFAMEMSNASTELLNRLPALKPSSYD
jgi:biopolymer transport protein ExbB/TolQ